MPLSVPGLLPPPYLPSLRELDKGFDPPLPAASTPALPHEPDQAGTARTIANPPRRSDPPTKG